MTNTGANLIDNLPADIRDLNDKHDQAMRDGDVFKSKLLAHITARRLNRYMGDQYHHAATLQRLINEAWMNPDAVVTATYGLQGEADALEILEYRSGIDCGRLYELLGNSERNDLSLDESISALLKYLPAIIPADDIGDAIKAADGYTNSISRNAP